MYNNNINFTVIIVGVEVRAMPKRRRSFHRHSIVENPQWIQYSETEQDLSDMNSSASLRGNKQWLMSPSTSEDRAEIRESFRSSLRQAGGNAVSQQSALTTSYNSQFDWKRWYREKVDSDED